MKIVGITAGPGKNGEGLSLTPFYAEAVRLAGAEPMILDIAADIPRAAEQIDALILSGGEDISPAYYGEELTYSTGIVPARDKFEFAMAHAVMEAGKPILGICRGAQILNAVFGGRIYQDIEKEMGLSHPLEHNHLLATVDGSEMARILGESPTVNSRHHQAIKRIGKGLRATAFSEDGIVEAFENTEKRIYGVQFHPEELVQNDSRIQELFQLIL